MKYSITNNSGIKQQLKNILAKCLKIILSCNIMLFFIFAKFESISNHYFTFDSKELALNVRFNAD